ncbi:hypothetical protein PoB_004914900, partial [Plakobranchus ocellatus]
STGQSCTDLFSCVERTTTYNFFFTQKKYTISGFNKAMDQVCHHSNYHCLRNPHGCTNDKLLKQALAGKKTRELLCTYVGRMMAIKINQKDKCVGKTIRIKVLRREYKKCISTSVGSMKGVDCKLKTLVTVECTKDFTCCHMGGKYVVGDMGGKFVFGHVGGKYVVGHMGGKYVVGHMGGKYLVGHMGGKYVVGHMGEKYVVSHMDGKYVVGYMGGKYVVMYLTAVSLHHLEPLFSALNIFQAF